MDQHEGMRVPADPCENSVLVRGFVNERFPVLVREHVVIQNGLLVDAERKKDQDGGGSCAVFSLCAVEEKRGFFIRLARDTRDLSHERNAPFCLINV